jgi:hypothetical protein
MVISQQDYERLDLSSLFPYKTDAFAVVVDNVFTEEECNHFIQMTEEIGYSEALIGGSQVRNVQQRNNCRCIVDDPVLAKMI